VLTAEPFGAELDNLAVNGSRSRAATDFDGLARVKRYLFTCEAERGRLIAGRRGIVVACRFGLRTRSSWKKIPGS
jgi:hypothetical protein